MGGISGNTELPKPSSIDVHDEYYVALKDNASQSHYDLASRFDDDR